MFRHLSPMIVPLRGCFCARPGYSLPLCPAGRAQLPWNRQACPRCALPQNHDGLCAHCLARSPPFVSAWAPLRLETPVQQQIHALKYPAAFLHARLLGPLFADALLARSAALPAVLLPVTLPSARPRPRGSNKTTTAPRRVGTEYVSKRGSQRTPI